MRLLLPLAAIFASSVSAALECANGAFRNTSFGGVCTCQGQYFGETCSEKVDVGGTGDVALGFLIVLWILFVPVVAFIFFRLAKAVDEGELDLDSAWEWCTGRCRNVSLPTRGNSSGGSGAARRASAVTRVSVNMARMDPVRHEPANDTSNNDGLTDEQNTKVDNLLQIMAADFGRERAIGILRRNNWNYEEAVTAALMES
ncbi:MAG: hypothetical protein MHM6MM_004978 [Cercozoa sp. M6MM]